MIETDMRKEKEAQVREYIAMCSGSYPVEKVCARVPEIAAQTDLVLKTLDPLLEDDNLSQAVRAGPRKCSRALHACGSHLLPLAGHVSVWLEQ
jgi:hypothetical protein